MMIHRGDDHSHPFTTIYYIYDELSLVAGARSVAGAFSLHRFLRFIRLLGPLDTWLLFLKAASADPAGMGP